MTADELATRPVVATPPWHVAFLPFAAGYFLSYLFRTINGPLAASLVTEYGLGPHDLGLATSMYFLAFAACQIPAGLLIDRYGPHRVQLGLLLLAAVGATLSAVAPSLGVMILGRLLIGVGCSGAFVTGVKVLALWLPPDRRALGNGLLVMCGGLGAVASTTPLELLVSVLTWRSIFGLLAAATLLVAGGVWRAAPSAPPAWDTPREMLGGLRIVVRDRRFWRIAPLSASVVGATFAIHGLWAARWLADVARLDAHAVNLALLGMGGTLTLGALLLGGLATALRRFGVGTPGLFAACTAVCLLIEAMLAAGPTRHPALLLAALAVFGSMTVLSFTIVGELFPPHLAGRANGVLNVMNLGTAFVLQAAIGGVLASWPMLAGGRSPAVAYATAFGGVAALQAASLAWFIWSAPRPRMARRHGLAMEPHDRLPPSQKLASWLPLARAERRAVRCSLAIGLVALCVLGGLALYVSVTAPLDAVVANAGQ